MINLDTLTRFLAERRPELGSAENRALVSDIAAAVSDYMRHADDMQHLAHGTEMDRLRNPLGNEIPWDIRPDPMATLFTDKGELAA